MTPKQKLFAEEYVKDCNGAQAAIRAGYTATNSRKYASDILTYQDVKLYIEQLNAEKAERNKVTADEVISGLREVAARCMQHKPVFNRKGEQVETELEDGTTAPAYVFDSKGANRALELLGKTTGMFSDNLNVNSTAIEIKINISDFIGDTEA